MANQHRMNTPKDCEYYLQRLDALPKKFDQVLEGLKLREQKGIIPPRFVVEKVLKEMTDFAAQPPAENILATSFKTRAAKIAELTDDAARRTAGPRRERDRGEGLSRLPEAHRLLRGAAAEDDDGRRRLEAAGWRGVLRLHAAPE